VYFVPAFSGLLAPHWRDDARGVLVGMTQFTDKHHIARAVLEAIAFQTVDVLRAVKRDVPFDIKKLRVDGGATKNDLLMQIQVCRHCLTDL
jgi:glycerol kinase